MFRSQELILRWPQAKLPMALTEHGITELKKVQKINNTIRVDR